MAYTIYQAAGWHGEPEDPVIGRTEDMHEAAMMAGERVDIRMPGGSNPHDCYALDEDGERIDPIESYRCDRCGELFEWGDDGPTAADDGYIIDEPGVYESHLLTWLCGSCAIDDYCWSRAGGCYGCDRCSEAMGPR